MHHVRRRHLAHQREQLVRRDVAVRGGRSRDEDDPHVNPVGAKGTGEIGIVGVAAAVANAAYHATGVRVRSLPITLEHFVGA